MSGDIHAREVVIGGTLTGSVHGSERVELQATAVVTGDVHTGSVLIQEGGVVNGRVLMGPSAPTIVGRPMAHEPAEPARR
jgi:cytoskeletal protein CcmA (bactofilin family)